MNSTTSGVDTELAQLQRETLDYFLHETNPANGLVLDKTAQNWPASIAAIGLALASYPVGVERGFMTRAAAVERTLATLRFFDRSPQGPEADATGYKGFYYHFLDMQSEELARERLGLAIPLRHQSAADRADDRELPQRPGLETDARLRADRHRPEARRVQRRL